MTTYDSPLLGHITEEQMKQLGEAATKAGTSMKRAIDAFIEAVPAIVNAIVEALPPLVDVTAKAVEAALKEVATPKEWHLMNHAKKARTRKKYRNRLIRRLREQKGGHRGVHTT